MKPQTDNQMTPVTTSKTVSVPVSWIKRLIEYADLVKRTDNDNEYPLHTLLGYIESAESLLTEEDEC